MTFFTSNILSSGMPEYNNNINALRASKEPKKMGFCIFLRRRNFSMNGQTRVMSYFLADEMYLKSPLFVHKISNPSTEEGHLTLWCRKVKRKDNERAFGVLQSNLYIITLPSRLWRLRRLRTTILCCVILHNRIFEERRPLDEILEATEQMLVGDGYEYSFFGNISRSLVQTSSVASVREVG